MRIKRVVVFFGGEITRWGENESRATCALSSKGNININNNNNITDIREQLVVDVSLT